MDRNDKAFLSIFLGLVGLKRLCYLSRCGSDRRLALIKCGETRASRNAKTESRCLKGFVLPCSDDLHCMFFRQSWFANA